MTMKHLVNMIISHKANYPLHLWIITARKLVIQIAGKTTQKFGLFVSI